MDLLLFLVFAGSITMSSAVTCYTCSSSSMPFIEETGSFERTNCSAPSSSNDFVDTDRNCTGTCLTTLSLTSSRFLYYRLDRTCLEGTPEFIMSQCEDGCTSPSNCRLCCNSDFCNNLSVEKIIEDYRMGQTCYQCRHSEIPYTGFYNPSCGLGFDSGGEHLRYSFCQGLCYSAVTFIEGIEDVQRGCSERGIRCDYANHPYMEDKSVALGDLDYDVKCCLGSLCNRAQSVGAITAGITFSAIASYVVSLALAP